MVLRKDERALRAGVVSEMVLAGVFAGVFRVSEKLRQFYAQGRVRNFAAYAAPARAASRRRKFASYSIMATFFS